MHKILLVEDNEMNRDMLSRRLIRRGYEVIIAVDGESGLALGEGGDGDVVGGLLGVEVLLGDELAGVEGLGAVEVELLLLEVGLGFARGSGRASVVAYFGTPIGRIHGIPPPVGHDTSVTIEGEASLGAANGFSTSGAETAC